MFSSNTTAANGAANYIEDVFSTYLYTGNGSTQTITNGIDMLGKGGMLWLKNRGAASNHFVYDSARASLPYWNQQLQTNQTVAQANVGAAVTVLNNGVTLTTASGANASANTYVGWTFRKQPKFFDVVTYTGNGSQPRAIPHNLTTTPGCVIVKNTSSGGSWYVYHRSSNASGFTAAESYMLLNNTNAVSDNAFIWGNTAPTSTDFTVSTQLNQSANTYVAYIFAHDAGGFGLTGTDNVISCGSFTSNGSGLATVNLGYEPQWVLVKSSSAVTNWQIVDNMRGFVAGAANASSKYLNANSSAAELDTPPYGLTSTGFEYNSAPSTTFIYIAIRRGPMKVPTDGTKVFAPVLAEPVAGEPAITTFTTNFPVDFSINRNKGNAVTTLAIDRLRGSGALYTNATSAESVFDPTIAPKFDSNINIKILSWSAGFGDIIGWNFRRAPGFFDEVCYTGTGSAQNVTHNLTVAPELMIVKKRSDVDVWGVWNTNRPLAGDILYLNLTLGWDNNAGYFNSTNPTSSVFSVGASASTNSSGSTYVAYLFASCPGVSKVGSVTHVEPTTVSCGFAPRFVLLKSTASTGTDDWFVFDSARGITAGNDPYLRLNSTGAENTPFGAADLIDPTADGFIMNGFGGGNYIFLAIA